MNKSKLIAAADSGQMLKVIMQLDTPRMPEAIQRDFCEYCKYEVIATADAGDILSIWKCFTEKYPEKLQLRNQA